MPSHLSNDDPAVNRPLPTLPHETWTHIFSYLQYQHSSTAQPSWEPWLVYRRVNRHFKDLVEAEYARHFLRGCAIVLDAGNDHIDCGETGIKGDTITRPRILRYEHVGFSNEAHAPEAMSEGDRFAIFRSKLDNAVETASIAQTQALSQPPRHSYHPNILMHLRTGATDLLPSDLRFISSKNDHTKSWTFIFDWRMYFCTLFNEVKDAAAFRDECWQKKLTNKLFLADDEKDDLDRGRGQSLVGLATTLYQQTQKKHKVHESFPVPIEDPGVTQVIDLSTTNAPINPAPRIIHPSTANWSSRLGVNVNVGFFDNKNEEDSDDLLSPHARAQLILAAGTYEVGVDGRYREVRRQRRRRLWHRLQNHDQAAEVRFLRTNAAAEYGGGEQRRQRIKFERLGEGRVARKLLTLQVQMAGQRSVIEW